MTHTEDTWVKAFINEFCELVQIGSDSSAIKVSEVPLWKGEMGKSTNANPLNVIDWIRSQKAVWERAERERIRKLLTLGGKTPCKDHDFNCGDDPGDVGNRCCKCGIRMEKLYILESLQ
jgi:hypothetical protein